MLKTICLSKIGNKQRGIIGYTLVDTNSNYVKVEAAELKRNIASGLIDVINLQLDKAGRLIDKSVAITPETYELLLLKIKHSYEKAVDYIIETKAFECFTEPDSYIGSFSREEQKYIRSLRQAYDSIRGEGKFDDAVTDYALDFTRYGFAHYAEVDQESKYIISASQEKVIDWCEHARDMLLADEWDMWGMKDIRNLIKSDLDIEHIFK